METVRREVEFMSLPEEILLHIFSFIEISRFNIASVCKKFYRLLCELERDIHPLKLSYSETYDDQIYTSLIKSSRKFKDLEIDLGGCKPLGSIGRIGAIVEKFGDRLERFKISCDRNLKPVCISEWQLIFILKKAPEIQDLQIYNVYVQESCSNVEVLNLYKMEKLSVVSCRFDTPMFFNRIPADVIQDLVFELKPPDGTVYQSFFNHHTKIKSLKIPNDYQIQFDHLELERLEIKSDDGVSFAISQQPKLRCLKLNAFLTEGDVFSEVCKLKHLEILKLPVRRMDFSCQLFQELESITNLKEFRMDNFSIGFLQEFSKMKFLKLEKLSLDLYNEEFPKEILLQISQNCGKLKHLKLIDDSIDIISVFSSFPVLESLHLSYSDKICGIPYDILEVSDELSHKNLEKIVIDNSFAFVDREDKITILKLLGLCPNLKKIKVYDLGDFTFDDLKHVIESHSRLTHLSLIFEEPKEFVLGYEAIDVLKTCGKNLIYLHFFCICIAPTHSELKALLEEKFPIIKVFPNNYSKTIMKKRNVPDWGNTIFGPELWDF